MGSRGPPREGAEDPVSKREPPWQAVIRKIKQSNKGSVFFISSRGRVRPILCKSFGLQGKYTQKRKKSQHCGRKKSSIALF
jgi:hypothetical protein